jgi:hypothetical protein
MSNFNFSADAQTPQTNSSTNRTSTNSVSVSGNGTVNPSQPQSVAESNVPVQLNPEQLAELQEEVNETYGGYPQELARESAPLPDEIQKPDPSTATNPITAPSPLDINSSDIGTAGNTGNNTVSNTTSTAINASSTAKNATQQLVAQQLAAPPIKLYKTSQVAPVDPRSPVNEPSVANKGNLVFFTGNWYAAKSIDFGSTWVSVNPFSSMPDFCCDQDVVYDKNTGIFLWYKQGSKNTAGENRFQLGVSKDASTWVFYNLNPKNFNSGWTNVWFDYPHIALTDKNLWISSNVFDNSGQFVRAVIAAFPLSQLANSQPVNFKYYTENQEFSFTPVQGAKDTMYWAVHHSNTQMKLYKWVEASSSINTRLVDVPAWSFGFRGTMLCPAPDGHNWCARSDSRISGGYLLGDVVGFVWHAKQGNGFNYPYVNIATFKTSDLSFVDVKKLWSPNLAFMFGFISPISSPASLGLVSLYGGGSYYPSIAAGVIDSYTGPNPPFQLITIRSGDHATDVSGDYMRDRPLNGVGPYWIGTGFTLQGCSTSNCVQPQFFAFGR